MLSRLLVAVIVGAAACAPAAAQDEIPLVLGDEAVDPSGATVAASAGETFRSEAPTWIIGPEDWGGYATVDALFLERANGIGPLAVTSPASDVPGSPVIAAGDVRYPMIPGVRVFRGWRGPDCSGFEVGYLGAWSMHADATAVSPGGGLALPGQLGLVAGSGFDAATAVRPTLDSSLNGFELNVFATREYGGCRRHDPLPWRRAWDVLEGTTATADWLLGIRWAGLDETGTLAVTALSSTPPPVFRTTAYRVVTSSQLVGPQIGHRRRVTWGDWTFEGQGKVALAGSILSQSQGAVVGPFDLVQIRQPRSSNFTGVGMIGDLNATVVRRLGDHWGLRAGYTLLWLAGAAPAANQWDFTDTPTSGTRLVTGSVFLHGATLGLEAAW